MRRVLEGLPASPLLFDYIYSHFTVVYWDIFSIIKLWDISCCRVWNFVAFFVTSEMAFSIVSILDRKLSKFALPFLFFSNESFACRRKTKLSNISMRSCSYRYTYYCVSQKLLMYYPRLRIQSSLSRII